MEYSEMNEQNWDNLCELYNSVANNSGVYTKLIDPVISFFSELYVWPDFSLLSSLGRSIEETVKTYDDLIIDKAISPFILVASHLSRNQALHDQFSHYGIRQVGQWPLIFYPSNKSFPNIETKKGFETKILSTTDDVDDWKTIAQKVLFQEGNLPVELFRGDRFELLLGYAKGSPVATALIFGGEHEASVHMVAVLPDHRKNGYGQRIFLEAISRCRDKGYSTVFAQASQMGKKPWIEIGFELSGHIDVLWKIGCTRTARSIK